MYAVEMADKKNSKKPLSLNDRNYRLLQDLSTPRPHHPPSKPSFSFNLNSSPEVEEEEEEKPPMIKIGHRRCEVTSTRSYNHGDTISRGSGFTDSTSLPKEEEEKPSTIKIEHRKFEATSTHNYSHGDTISCFSGIPDSTSLRKEEKTVKIKIAGRRRLCKVSSQDVENVGNRVGTHEPSINDLNDFESPPPKNVGESKMCGGGNDIRDILNDLSSRLDLLSIEKKRPPKQTEPEPVEDYLIWNKEKHNNSKADLPEYRSADSSFSRTSDSSDTSSDVTENVEGRLNGSKKSSERPKKNESLFSVGQSLVSSDAEEEGYLQNEYERENCVGMANGYKQNYERLKETETKWVDEKVMSVGRSFASNANDEEDDNCVVLSDRLMAKKSARQCGKSKEYDDSSVIHELDDITDDSVMEDESYFTLRGPNSTFKLSGKIAKMLYPHQRDGLRWLWSLHCKGKGGILGDDMGLGKTMQICGFLAGLFHSHLIKRVLIVAPKTLLSHWIKELSVVGLSDKTREYFGTCAKLRLYELQYILQDKGVLLTTYDIVRNNVKSLRGDNYFHHDGSEDCITWDYMILDEGHLIKNPNTQRAQSLLEIPSTHRIIISGTPIQNNLKELWALFNFCCPELLGDKLWFKKTYESHIVRGSEKNASDREKLTGSRVAKDLRERIQPYFLRRLKSEVFNEDDTTNTAKLSKKNEIIVWLKLTSCQQKLYEAFLRSEIVLSAFDGSPLAALTILKKICDHPLLLTKRAAEDVLEELDSTLEPEDVSVAEKLAMHIADVAEIDDFEEKHDNISCKLSFILSLLDTLIPEGHSVLVFSQTRKMLNLIQESIATNGYKFLRIDGTTKASDRVNIVNEFQQGTAASVFLLTSQVGGLGLTLTKADRVIVVDPAWNPSTDNQSVDRAYRIGQKKDVLVYRLMTCGTVEEKIYRKQIFKGGLFKTATEHKEQIRYFSQQDLRDIFSLPKEGFGVSLTQKQLHEEHDRQHKIDESFEAHIKFLETKGIAGISHHSLLFSKTAPTPVVDDDEDAMRKRGATFVQSSSSCSSFERNVNGADYAFKPKDVKLTQKTSSPDSVGKLTESEIKERINRLSQILANKVTVARLPDQGEKVRKKIDYLKLELDNMRMTDKTEPEVIDLDDITGKLQRVLNV